MKIIRLILLTLTIASCTSPEEQKVPLIDGQLLNGGPQQILLYLNNTQTEFIDTIAVQKDGVFIVNQESIVTPGFYYLDLGNNDRINLFLHPGDFIQLSFDPNDANQTCSSKNSKFLNAYWEIEKNTILFSQEITKLTNQFKITTDTVFNADLYNHLYQAKDSITKKFRKRSIEITKGIKNPVLTYFMLNQKAGNTSLFSLEKELKLFLDNAEKLMNHPELKELFTEYDQHLMQAYSSIRSIERYSKGGQLPALRARTNWDEELNFTSTNGKLIHLILWTAEEEYNEQLIPEIKNLMRRYGNRGLKTVMPAYQTDKQIWKNSIKKYNLPYWHLIDTLALNSPDLQELGIRSLPCNFLITPEGAIVQRDLWGNKLDEAIINYLKNN
jgi:hypothetical protein